MDQLGIEYDCGKNCQSMPIHNYVKLLGEGKWRALPFWYILTGCNTVSSFSRRGKKTTLNARSCFLVTAYMINTSPT